MNSGRIAAALANNNLTCVRVASSNKVYLKVKSDGAVEQFKRPSSKVFMCDALRAAVFSAGIDTNSKDLGAEL